MEAWKAKGSKCNWYIGLNHFFWGGGLGSQKECSLIAINSINARRKKKGCNSSSYQWLTFLKPKIVKKKEVKKKKQIKFNMSFPKGKFKKKINPPNFVIIFIKNAPVWEACYWTKKNPKKTKKSVPLNPHRQFKKKK